MSTERQQRRSAQILDAALKVFAARGYHDASVGDVARAAGVSEKTVYDYFSSKEELLFAIPIAPTFEAIDSLESALPYVRGAGNKIRAIIFHFFSYYAEHPDFAKVNLLYLRRNPNYLKTEIFERLRVSYRVVDRVVEEGIESGEFRDDADPELIRWAVMGAAEYIVLRWLQHDEPSDPAAYVDPLADLIVNGIRRDPAAAGVTLRLNVEPGAAHAPEIVSSRDTDQPSRKGGKPRGSSTRTVTRGGKR
jgi:AcrR family transcriptional regulator